MNNTQNQTNRQRPHRGMMGGRGMHPGEKPKDLKGSLGKLMGYIGKYKLPIVLVYDICLPAPLFLMWQVLKILGKATTALTEGLMNKIQGQGGIDFTRIGRFYFLYWLCIWEVLSSVLSRDGS